MEKSGLNKVRWPVRKKYKQMWSDLLCRHNGRFIISIQNLVHHIFTNIYQRTNVEIVYLLWMKKPKQKVMNDHTKSAHKSSIMKHSFAFVRKILRSSSSFSVSFSQLFIGNYVSINHRHFAGIIPLAPALTT